MPEKEQPIEGQIESIVDDAIAVFGKGKLPRDFAEGLCLGEFQSRIIGLVGQYKKGRFDVDKMIADTYARKGGGEKLRQEAREHTGKVRTIELVGEKATYSLMQIPGSDTISIDTEQHGWLGVIGINSRKNEAWGYPRQGTGLNTNSWSELMQEAAELFREFGGVDKFLELEFETVTDRDQKTQAQRDMETKSLLDELYQ